MTDTGGMEFSSGDDLNIEALNNFVLAHKDWGVMSNLVVTATTGMAVSIAKGKASIDGTSVDKNTFTSNQSISAADANYDRYDLVLLDNTGSVVVVTGTTTASNAAETPSYDYATNKAIPLAELYIPAGTSSMSSSNIKDMRVFVSPPFIKVSGSNTLEASDDLEEGTNSTTFTLMKTLTASSTGFHHFSIEYRSSEYWNIAYIEIRYYDGSTETVLESTSTSSTAYVELSLGVEVGSITDEIRVYLRNSDNNETTYIRNARLYDITETSAIDRFVFLFIGNTSYAYYSTSTLSTAGLGTKISANTSTLISNLHKLYVYDDIAAYSYVI